MPTEGTAVPIDLDSVFAGGRGFEIGPPFPAIVYAANITSDSTGVGLDTADDIRTVLLQGVSHGEPLCPPMPVGPDGAFGGLTPQDALDIAVYLKSIPPIRKTVSDCEFPLISKPVSGAGAVASARARPSSKVSR
jgi:hypothetical protein